MRKLLGLVILLVLCFWPLQAFAETIYLWTDAQGKMHITQEAHSETSRIVDVMEYEPQPDDDTKTAQPPKEKKPKKRLNEEKCRLAAERQRIARDTREIARTAEERAGKMRRQAQDLKTRVG